MFQLANSNKRKKSEFELIEAPDQRKKTANKIAKSLDLNLFKETM